MLSEETRRKLREMNFGELVEAIDLQEKQPEYLALTFDERMNLAVDQAYSAKYNAKVHRLIHSAKFRIADATLVNVFYEKRGLDKEIILSLGTCGFIEKNQPVVFNGFTGSGKSYLACAIGRQACMQGYRTRYIRVPDLMQLLGEASLDIHGRAKLLKKFVSANQTQPLKRKAEASNETSALIIRAIYLYFTTGYYTSLPTAVTLLYSQLLYLTV
ncbi:ATP-binding protein, partial [Ruminococcus albus]